MAICREGNKMYAQWPIFNKNPWQSSKLSGVKDRSGEINNFIFLNWCLLDSLTACRLALHPCRYCWPRRCPQQEQIVWIFEWWQSWAQEVWIFKEESSTPSLVSIPPLYLLAPLCCVQPPSPCINETLLQFCYIFKLTDISRYQINVLFCLFMCIVR